MRKAQADLFGAGVRMISEDAVDMTVASLNEYGPRHDHWAIGWSGGKDSTAVVTLLAQILEEGRVAPPRAGLTIYRAQTRLELPPLDHAAQLIEAQLRSRGYDVREIIAPLDQRFMVYMLGRGVTPPNNRTLRWCTGKIKVDPMRAAVAELVADKPGEILFLTGVRQGESAIRDGRIAMSCGVNGAECGQGWYQQVLPNSPGIRGRIATLAPLLHWRVCHVWDWLKIYAPMGEFGGWDTAVLADAYGGDEAEEHNGRTGCVGCPVVQEETALHRVVALPQWSYLAPLQLLQPLWRELRWPVHRLRQPGLPPKAKPGRKQHARPRMGPLTFAARLMALQRVLEMQRAVNSEADRRGRPRIDILNAEEEARIRELIALKTWPNGWTGDEPPADSWGDEMLDDGSIQPPLFGAVA